jgi:hypothetical protein
VYVVLNGHWFSWVLVIVLQEVGLTLTMIKLQTRYGSKARLQWFTKKVVVKFSLKSRLQD